MSKGKTVIHYYVDEAGDTTLFGRRGKILVGSDGCSKYFIMGKLEIADPEKLSEELEALRSELLTDPYFNSVPSMQPGQKKTALAFHAKDDVPEVRREVYKVLLRYDVRFYAVVRDKRYLVAYVRQRNEQDKSFRYNQNEQYDGLVKELFCKLHHMADEVNICFAQRGNKPRNDALRKALEDAENIFEENFGFRHPANHNIESSTPPKNAGLQAVDYYLWALQRFYERGEERYLGLICPQVGEIHDLDFIENGKRGVFYNKNEPLNLAAHQK